MIVEPGILLGRDLNCGLVELRVFESGAKYDFTRRPCAGHLCDHMIQSNFVCQKSDATLKRASRTFSQTTDHAAVLPRWQVDCHHMRTRSLLTEIRCEFAKHVIRCRIVRLMRTAET